MRIENNQELIREAADLARRLREFQRQANISIETASDALTSTIRSTPVDDREKRSQLWRENSQRLTTVYDRLGSEFEPLRSEAVALRNKIITRVPNPPKEDL
jgi:hypothetical protein